MRRLVALASVCLVSGLAACGPAATGRNLVPPSSPRAEKHVKLPLRIFIPKRIGSHRTGRDRPTHRSRGTLHQLFIAANSAGVAFAVFPHGVRSSPIASLVGDISSSSPNCTPVSDGRSCSFALDVRPGGPYDFLLSTFDKAPIGGTIPPGAVQLGAGVTTTTIAAGTANAIHMTVGGVVASTFVFVPAPDVFHAIASKSERLTIGALDADGNVIATDGYVDGYGNPLAITPAADSNAGTTVTFSPAQISAPQPNGVLLEYSALAATAVQLQNGFTATISANAGGATAGTFTLKVVKPERALTFSTDNQPLYVAVAQDRIFVTAPASNGFDYTFGATLVQARFPSAKPSDAT